MGSGKSTVCRLFMLLGIPGYDSDTAAKRLMQSDPTLRGRLADLFTPRVFAPSGELDRGWLAARVFSDPQQLALLNEAVHPAVARDFMRWKTEQLHTGVPYILLESAILFESGFDRLADATVAVTAPEALRIARSMLRDGITQEQAAERLRRQMTDADRASRADYVIANDGSRLLWEQVQELDKLFGICA